MSSNSPPKSPAHEVCYSDDETMQRRLLRKRQLEDSEIYNAPETMAVKRRAVKEAAKTTPVPKEIPNLTFDDQIEPSETLEHEEDEEQDEEQGEERDEAPVHTDDREVGSNAAQSGVGAVQDVTVVAVPVGSPDDTVMVDAGADKGQADSKNGNDDGPEGENEQGNSDDKEGKSNGKKGRSDGKKGNSDGKKGNSGGKKGKSDGKMDEDKKGRSSVGAKAIKPKSKVQPVLLKVTLDPKRWVQKSDQAARRSRHRLRRLLKEEEALLSSQLQVV